MPDITMCNDTECPYRDKCYRYTATPSPFWQSYFMGSPMQDGKCEYFLENDLTF